MAGDDAQGWEILDKINHEAVKDPDLYVFTNMTGVGSMEVNVFQRTADVVLQNPFGKALVWSWQRHSGKENL